MAYQEGREIAAVHCAHQRNEKAQPAAAGAGLLGRQRRASVFGSHRPEFAVVGVVDSLDQLLGVVLTACDEPVQREPLSRVRFPSSMRKEWSGGSRV